MASAPSTARATAALGQIGRYSDILMAVAVVSIIAMMIVPLPKVLLDILISVNLAASLTILLVAMYTQQPLQFSSFPSLLLIATLYRLGLNISSSRLILLEGDAGQVIKTFGSFVIGGNYVVGVVVFLILVVIQFVVITNGAGRVAEVAARFTLDAMPGKQMAIDADLNAGLITAEQARERRRGIEREANFYGAMDGASKFVKGDAIAGIVIIIVNIIGGFVIGILQRGLDPMQALGQYTLLTVGDGLVTQIPALLISTAAGIIVTRSAAEADMGRDVGGQVLGNPRALGVVAGLMALFVLIPGLPKAPFIVISTIFGGLAYLLQQQRRLAAQAPAAPPAAPATTPEEVTQLLALDPMELEIGYGLIPLVDAGQGGNLLSRISLIRRQIALDLGIVLPTIRIRDNLQLPPNAYAIMLRGVPIARGEARPDRYLAMNAGLATEPVDGVPTTEPTFGLPALWIDPADRERAELSGYAVVDPASVVTTHLTEVIRANAHHLLTRQDVQHLLNTIKNDHGAVVNELIPELLSLGELQQVLQRLLRERISIRDLVTILEALANHARATRDIVALTEFVRQALGRAITDRYTEEDGRLYVMTLHPSLQRVFSEALQSTETGPTLAVEPALVQRFIQRVSAQMEQLAAAGHQPILLCPGPLRPALRRLTERALPTLVVLSYNEVATGVEVHATGMIRVDEVE
jgi:flagellar biosynthesis protein FlhA